MESENMNMQSENNSENNQNDNNQSNSDNNKEKMQNWLQDNLRIIVSVLIVVAIAAGVYSYSKRSERQLAMEDQSESQTTDEGIISDQDETVAPTDTPSEQANEETSTETSPATENSPAEDSVSSQPVSQETEGSFVETAAKGDGLTHLSRRALANYLEKNPDSSLTPEHKIYIEDYLRKTTPHTGGVNVGTSVEFSKKTIQDAITKAKSLNERQLNNLKKYSSRVSSLS